LFLALNEAKETMNVRQAGDQIVGGPSIDG